MLHARAALYAVCLCAAGGAGFAFAPSALADVKAGVDAWTRGDFPAAVAEWRDPAAEGDPDAQFNLAQAYRLGRGVPANPKQAEVLYAKAAAQGHLKAADNYGLLLFQDGRREAAMPYLLAASQRGDPRAHYLVGLAHFNGDLLPKDWVKAYALLTLSNSAGLPQAAAAITQMDGFIPRDQREQAQTLAQVLKRDMDAQRTAQLAAVDLGADMPSGPGSGRINTPTTPAVVAMAPAVLPRPVGRVPQPARATPVPPSVAAAQAAVAEAERVTGASSPANAGADFVASTRTAAAPPPRSSPPVAKPQPRVPTPASATPARVAAPAKTPSAVRDGPWKLQLGAFAVNGNADKLWAQLSSRKELSGTTKLVVPAGRLTKLLAGGYPSRAAAEQACASLKRAGKACLVTR